MKARAQRGTWPGLQLLVRLWAMMRKEFVQLRRDRPVFATIIALPLLEVLLYGYAINSDPRHLPTAVLVHEQGPITRAVIASFRNTEYFRFTEVVHGSAEMDEAIRKGRVQFAIEFPAHFERDVRKGLKPTVLVVADATDPIATQNALASLSEIGGEAVRRELRRPEAAAAPQAPFRVMAHRRFNPEIRSQMHIVPGLLGMLLTLTMTVFTALAVTRETERGTMETLLSRPISPLEIMLGKILPFVVVGLVQGLVIVLVSRFVFDVPIYGGVGLLSAVTALFVLVNLSIGYVFSTIARTQLQAVQLIILFYLPSTLLSGFMFPYRGMPAWAQWTGEFLPLTHFLRVVRGVMLKGSGLDDVLPEVLLLAAFVPVAMGAALLRFRRTLD